MNILALDFETFFADDYTPKKLTIEAYVRDPRFEVHGCGFRWGNDKAFWVSRVVGLEAVFAQIDWPNTAVLCHHAQFDGLILSHHFGVKPGFWLDTLSMARQIHGNQLSVALDALARYYKLPRKTVPYDQFRGRHWPELSAEVRKEVADGCLHDVDLTWRIFQELAKIFPKEEYPIVDLTVRMFTEPALVGDPAYFQKLADDEFNSKQEKLYNLGVDEAMLQSATKFCDLLKAEGVEIEMKAGRPAADGTPKAIPAIAKTDQFMRNLLEDDNERIRDLAQCRLDTKSTLAETRAERLADMSARGPLCVYLGYAAAHTTRWAGGDKVNFQNLPRSGELRRGLMAPLGYLFASIDQRQGEARIVDWLAGQKDSIERFERGEDPYLPVASAYYGREITAEDKIERQMGKVIKLACGFGMGDRRLKATLGAAGIVVDDDESKRGITAYRSTHRYVVNYWGQGEWALGKLARREAFEWGPFSHPGDGRLYLPNGGWLDYRTLEWWRDDDGDLGWRLIRRSGWQKIYGAKLVENVVQALSRVVTSRAMLRARAAGYKIVGMSHDDIWVLAPKDGAERHAEILRGFMKVRPDFAPDLPIDAEAKLGESYG